VVLPPFFLGSAPPLALGSSNGFFCFWPSVYTGHRRIVPIHPTRNHGPSYHEEHRASPYSVVSRRTGVGKGCGHAGRRVTDRQVRLARILHGARAIELVLVEPLDHMDAWTRNRQFIFLKKLRQVLQRCCVSDGLGHRIGMFGHNYVNDFLLTWLPFTWAGATIFQMYAMAKIGGEAYLIGCLPVPSRRAGLPIIHRGGRNNRLALARPLLPEAWEPGGFFFIGHQHSSISVAC